MLKPHALFVALITLLPLSAVAQDQAQYNRALSAFNAGDFDTSARIFFELAETSTDPEVKPKAEYYLAQSFQNKGLPIASITYYSGILKEGKAHPYYLKAVEGLVNVQAALDDQFLIPNVLNAAYDQGADVWSSLPLEVLARINYLIGGISQRRAKFDEARQFLEAVPRETAMYAQAQYLLGVVLADPRYPGRAEDEKTARDLDRQSIERFQTVIDLNDPRQVELQETKWLATLGLGRVHYGAGEYARSVEAYESIPRFTRYWNVALFENGFARFQNEDFGGALGSLQALYAPQFAGAFQPESYTLSSTIMFFSCLYEESKNYLRIFDQTYLPMQEQLRPLVEGEEREPKFYFDLITAADPKLPRPVLLWVRGNERLKNVLALVTQIRQEREAINAIQSWRQARVAERLGESFDATESVLVDSAGRLTRNRLTEASGLIKEFSDQAEIIRFETAKAETELVESAIDQQKLLSDQKLFRPRMPAENWNYWKFQGEFWFDEIGYYQYTLKNGCPAAPQE